MNWRILPPHIDPEKIAKLIEVGARYRRKVRQQRAQRSFNIAVLRVAELDRLFADRYGGPAYVLPDDDAGRDDAFIMLSHLAHCPIAPQRIRERWLAQRGPWLKPAERKHLLARKPLRFGADKLAWRLGLTYEQRQRLDIHSIGAVDATKVEREALAKAARRERDQARREQQRRDQGRTPREQYEAQSASRTKPWEAEGVSRATWYRRQRETGVSPRIEDVVVLQVDTLVSPSEPLRRARPKPSHLEAKAQRKPHRSKGGRGEACPLASALPPSRTATTLCGCHDQGDELARCPAARSYGGGMAVSRWTPHPHAGAPPSCAAPAAAGRPSFPMR